MLGWDELGIAINEMAQGVDLEGVTVSFLLLGDAQQFDITPSRCSICTCPFTNVYVCSSMYNPT